MRTRSSARRSRREKSREIDVRLAIEDGTDDLAAIAAMEYVSGMRPSPQDLLHERLVYAQAGQGREQAGETRCCDVERSKLCSTLSPDLADGSISLSQSFSCATNSVA